MDQSALQTGRAPATDGRVGLFKNLSAQESPGRVSASWSLQLWTEHFTRSPGMWIPGNPECPGCEWCEERKWWQQRDKIPCKDKHQGCKISCTPEFFSFLSSDVPQNIQALGNPRNSAAASRLPSLALGTSCCCIPGSVGESDREVKSLHLKRNRRKVLSQGSGRLRDPAAGKTLRNWVYSAPFWIKSLPRGQSSPGSAQSTARAGAAPLCSRRGSRSRAGWSREFLCRVTVIQSRWITQPLFLNQILGFIIVRAARKGGGEEKKKPNPKIPQCFICLSNPFQFCSLKIKFYFFRHTSCCY